MGAPKVERAKIEEFRATIITCILPYVSRNQVKSACKHTRQMNQNSLHSLHFMERWINFSTIANDDFYFPFQVKRNIDCIDRNGHWPNRTLFRRRICASCAVKIKNFIAENRDILYIGKRVGSRLLHGKQNELYGEYGDNRAPCDNIAMSWKWYHNSCCMGVSLSPRHIHPHFDNELQAQKQTQIDK